MNPFPKRPTSLRIRFSNKCISISSSNTKTLPLGGFFVIFIYMSKHTDKINAMKTAGKATTAHKTRKTYKHFLHHETEIKNQHGEPYIILTDFIG